MLPLSSNFLLLISSAVFIALFLFCMLVTQYVHQDTRKRKVIEKIRSSAESGDGVYEAPMHESSVSATPPLLLSFFRLLGDSSKHDFESDYSTMRIRFLRAGIRWEHSGSAFWGAKIFFTSCLPAVFFMLRISVFKLISNPVTLGLTILIALGGFYLPDAWLRIKADRRKEIISKGLPDALDLLVICVESGMGLDSALNRVAVEMELSNPVLSSELHLLNLELRAGKLRQNALRNLALRIDLEEVGSLVTLLIQTDRFGTSVATALRVYSDAFRTQRFQKAEEIAAKMAVKLMLPLIFFIFPSLFVVLLGPAAIKIYQNIIMP